MKSSNLAQLHDLPPIEWSAVQARLDAGLPQAPGDGGPNRHTCWITTLDADGAPHTTGIGALWHDGAYWFETGPTTRKARNLERDGRCSVAVATDDFDIVVRGTAARVTDPQLVAEAAALWAEGGWPCEVDESGTALTAEFSAPSAGTPPWWVYRVTAQEVIALATSGEGGATRWTM